MARIIIILALAGFIFAGCTSSQLPETPATALPCSDDWLVQWKLAKTYRALKENEKAIIILEKLDAEKPDNSDIKKELALAYEDVGCKENTTPWQSARKEWDRYSELLKEKTEEWWEAKYHFVLIECQLGNYKEALYAMKIMEEIISPEYDNNKWGYKDKFNDLRRKIKG